MPELPPVLWEMGIYPNVMMTPSARAMTVPNMDVAMMFAKHFLYTEPGSEQEKRLLAAFPSMMEETPDGFTMRGYVPPQQAVVWWRVGG